MEGYLAEVRFFGGNFAPRAWMLCQGQLLAIAQFDALFALLGTTYGGDGQSTFALPDFRGRAATGTGQGPGLSNIQLGEMAGSESITLTSIQMPAHSHTVFSMYHPLAESGTAADSNDPTGKYPAQTTSANEMYTSTSNANMGPCTISAQVGVAGGSQPFSIMQPYMGFNFVICIEGIFPSRN